MAVNIPLRQDANNYTEGLIIGEAIMIDIGKASWIQPGVTITDHLMVDAGTISVPKITGSGGTVTDICLDGDAGTANEARVNLQIDKKVTGKFDGCFTVAGIADKKVERALNDYKLMAMKENMEDYIHAELVANSTISTVDKLDYAGNPAGYLNALRIEYRKNTKQNATVALVSLDFYQEILDSGANLGTPLGDELWVNGQVGKVSGLLIIPVDVQEVDAILYNPMGLHRGIPTNTKSIDENILGAISQMPNADFSNGFVSMYETQGIKAIIETWVHQFFGILIPEATWVLSTPPIIAP